MAPFETDDEAIELAIRAPFGLATYAFARDVYRAKDLGHAIDAGVMCITSGGRRCRNADRN